MTLYLLDGLLEGGAGVRGAGPEGELVQKAFRSLVPYRDALWRSRLQPNADPAEALTFFNFVCSSFADPSWLDGTVTPAQRRELLDYSFAHWKELPPRLKAMLALTLKRMGRGSDARLVFDSVMDTATTTRDDGTFWPPEDRGWLWTHDAIETHAFALRTLLELSPHDPRVQGLIQWLFLNKKLSHWKSTRATAEVLYALAKALQQDRALGVREEAVVTVGKQEGRFVFTPERYEGKRHAGRVRGQGRSSERGDPGRQAGQGVGLRLGDLAVRDRRATQGGAGRLLWREPAVLQVRHAPSRTRSRARVPESERQ